MPTLMRLWIVGYAVFAVSQTVSAQTSYNRWDARQPAPITAPTRTAVKTELKLTPKIEVNHSDSLAELATPRKTNELLPVFPGGHDVFMGHIKSHLKQAKGPRPSGTMYITYTVLTTGATSNVRIAPGRGLSPSYDAAVIDVISRINNFSPGKRNGQPAAMEVTMPVSLD